MKKTTVIGLLGPTLDDGRHGSRWERWRPSVALCQHEELLVHRFELIHGARFRTLAETIAADIGHVSPETEVVLRVLEFKDAWDFEDVYGTLLDFVTSYHFDTDNEDYLIHITTGTHVAQICLFLLTESHYLPGRLLQTSPPLKGDRSGAGTFRIIDLDLSQYDRIAARFAQQRDDSLAYLKSGIPTRNAAFNRTIEQIERVAIASKSPLLLMGPTGAGKSQLARRVYELKREKHKLAGMFVEINCATLRGDAAMSSLFGHKKGAFTGANSDRAGLLRAANGGMLFLDEIGELGPDEQAMLLRAIEEHRFLPVGSDKEVSSEFQVIAGTNRNLQRDVASGHFREDLLARINLWTFRLPGLAARREDIEPNLDYELLQYAQKHGTQVGFNKEARQHFLRFAVSADATWRGNFRDLNASVTRMGTLSEGGRITKDVVVQEIERLRSDWQPQLTQDSPDLVRQVLGENTSAELDLFTHVQLNAVLQVCVQADSMADAGRKLFSVSRQAKERSNDSDRLRKYLQKFEISWDRLKLAGGSCNE